MRRLYYTLTREKKLIRQIENGDKGALGELIEMYYAGNECVSGRAWTVAAKHPSRRGNRYGK